ncbi:MAG TPA: carboxypeptidase regulatory-like domain-containing protein, partial [Bacteroidia bacterium]|nr:carboxypeptidase regulatory-like domain-containing protein [Bacteroidia bacterium]
VINIVFTNANTGTPVAGAEVGLTGILEKETTNAAGEVQFSVAPGEYDAVVEAAGFANGNFPLEANTPGVYSFTFQLTPMP